MIVIEMRQLGVDFIFVFVKIFNQVGVVVWFVGNVGIMFMQDQLVMIVDFKFGGDYFQKFFFYLFNVFVRGELCLIVDVEDVCVYGDGWLVKGGIQYYVGGFMVYVGQCFQCCFVFWYFVIVLF